MTHRYDHLVSFALEHPWAVTRPMLGIIASILGRRVAGLQATEEEIQAALVNRKNLPQPVEGGPVALIPVWGVIAPRANMLTQMSGGTTFQTLTAQLRQAMASKEIKTIIFDIDSPGGSVAGATEFAREVLKARAKKPIIAVGQYTMASAAYWLAACCTEIVAAPTTLLGSIGVFLIHEDLSEAMKMEGVKQTYIFAGKYKVDGNDSEPLAKEAAQDLQAKVDYAYGLFLADVSKGRGVPVTDVRSGYGQGRVVTADEGLALGMIDQIATLEDTLARVMSGPVDTPAARAVASIPSAVDTPQEPSPATGQDRRAEIALERQLFELQLATK